MQTRLDGWVASRRCSSHNTTRPSPGFSFYSTSISAFWKAIKYSSFTFTSYCWYLHHGLKHFIFPRARIGILGLDSVMHKPCSQLASNKQKCKNNVSSKNRIEKRRNEVEEGFGHRLRYTHGHITLFDVVPYAEKWSHCMQCFHWRRNSCFHMLC